MKIIRAIRVFRGKSIFRLIVEPDRANHITKREIVIRGFRLRRNRDDVKHLSVAQGRRVNGRHLGRIGDGRTSRENGRKRGSSADHRARVAGILPQVIIGFQKAIDIIFGRFA